MLVLFLFLFQAEDGMRGLVRSRGLGDVYKRQPGSPRAVSVGALAKSADDRSCITKSVIAPRAV